MQDGTPLGDDASISQRATPLQNFSAALTRGEAAFKMFRDFSVCGLRELASTTLQGLTDSRQFGAMDLYDRPLQEAQELLNRQDIQYTFQSADKPCSPENFKNTAWTINSEEGVTLLTYGDRVVGIQRGIHQSENRDNPNL